MSGQVGVSESPDGSVSPSLDRGTSDIRLELSAHVENLRYVVGTIGVCVQALHQQNADLDRDIALVLQRAAGDKLYETTERIEALAIGMNFQEI
jgi:hypothetical protein